MASKIEFNKDNKPKNSTRKMFTKGYAYLLPIACLLSTSCTTSYEHLLRAEEFSKNKNYASAIDEYQRHMNYRLTLDNRPEWENPYLYLLIIGDMKLAEREPEEALKQYQAAEEQKVDSGLVSDRYRYLANWYYLEGQPERALEILNKYHDRDPLLFDATADRIAKDIVAKESSNTSTK